MSGHRENIVNIVGRYPKSIFLKIFRKISEKRFFSNFGQEGVKMSQNREKNFAEISRLCLVGDL